MNVVVSDGSTRDIVAGQTIRIKPGFLPEWYDNQDLLVTKVETVSGANYPYIRFFHQELNDQGVLETVQDEESAVSGDIIL